MKNVFSDWVYLQKGSVQVLPNWKLKMYFNLKGKVHCSESEWLFTYLQAPTNNTNAKVKLQEEPLIFENLTAQTKGRWVHNIFDSLVYHESKDTFKISFPQSD